jgi:hypothetical protein
MVIFHSYVKLPEGNYTMIFFITYGGIHPFFEAPHGTPQPE